MNAIQVNPLKSVDGIKFGAKRSEVRAACGEECREFKKSRFSDNTSDGYDLFHVFYDKNDCMTAVEFFEGATVVIGENVVFPASVETATKVIQGLKEEDDGSLVSVEASVGISFAEDRMESILFGTEGYFG